MFVCVCVCVAVSLILSGVYEVEAAEQNKFSVSLSLFIFTSLEVCLISNTSACLFVRVCVCVIQNPNTLTTGSTVCSSKLEARPDLVDLFLAASVFSLGAVKTSESDLPMSKQENDTVRDELVNNH